MPKIIRVGVIGAGNCFAGLAQGIEYYKNHKAKEVVGLMHQRIGPYGFSDIEFVSAFDVGKNKIGRPLSEAVYKSPNMVKWTQLPPSKTVVKEAPILDGVGVYVLNKIQPLKNPTSPAKLKSQILEELQKTKTEILINYLPVGSQKATEFWADVALQARCAFINCIPVFIASDKKWSARFARAKLPVIGDDIKGQIGATIVHRVLAKLCDDRGTKIEKTYQLNVGGNTDFLNMKEQSRLKSKKISKTTSVQSQLKEELKADKIYIGPSDFIPFLGNTKLCFLRIDGKMFADVPYSMELRLEVDDKANSAGVAIDALRCARLALDRHKGGYLDVSSYFMKHPLRQYSDAEAKKVVDEFVKTK
ncbi:MAG: myo-inositol-1-phosphate synthase [Candidatus Portnoybacteria bacterium CG_4_8_14_3_um_filter_40_10]|uniref:Myo-inositol-1-phosphate synthase n=4 Tax=Candidatus Portnoyibacteriota TaxID=1817913 RepID=A0A2M7IHG3_9BACT|nr:MAG: myo-inositol-1-phosphate synthase [Candidatus Portnoybacteria bacterium CG11_big_fil_rev_8_21_14_0_20_40_15]PIW75970.1 MAG: myo-inositol-1-phosphate synthase [Candidatus Portnoybacteria bacterium CG_4_8_14_3_um_filter_40_10]PIY73943.1 MAG: myo-inositol-1-phosphate synthase [Candidatus Portnoybacteria bacterium CG_4_10_14_0_8_um_filter_40_50]PJA64584.1 MAG: myo-inositol-1-phosphate synthase [Candidatus Portnoybacteria bacterium CG_4_9_14_3_um_filter_40_10]